MARDESQHNAPTSRRMSQMERLENELRAQRTARNLDRVIQRLKNDEARKTTGYVYFLRCEQYVKVGYSSNPSSRLKALAVMSPFPCYVLGKIAGGIEDEAALHEKLKAHHHRGEWFVWNDDVERIITAAISS